MAIKTMKNQNKIIEINKTSNKHKVKMVKKRRKIPHWLSKEHLLMII